MKKYIDRCDEKLKEAKKVGDKTKIEKLKIVRKILEQEDAFMYMSMDTAFQIFNDLGYTIDEAKAEYLSATAFKSN